MIKKRDWIQNFEKPLKSKNACKNPKALSKENDKD